METGKLYYEHSGKFSLSGSGLMLGAGIGAGAVLGTIYGYVVAFNPFVYINFLATVIAAGMVGIAVGAMARPGKVRSLKVCMLMGLVAGVTFEYFQWWATLRFYEADPTLSNPGLMWSQMQVLAELGPWSMRGTTPSGGFFKFIWGLEALILVVGATLVTVGAGAEPFCEECETYSRVVHRNGPFDHVGDDGALVARIERGDFGSILAFERTEVSTERFSELHLSSCEGCKHLRLATLVNVTMEEDDDGKEERKESDVFTHLLVDASTYEEMSKL